MISGRCLDNPRLRLSGWGSLVWLQNVGIVVLWLCVAAFWSQKWEGVWRVSTGQRTQLNLCLLSLVASREVTPAHRPFVLVERFGTLGCCDWVCGWSLIERNSFLDADN